MLERHGSIALFYALVVFMFVFTSNSTSNNALAQKGNKVPAIELISPRSGDVLVAGQTIRVEWKTLNPNKGANTDWCEQEIFLSLEGERVATRRISPQLGPHVTYFDWVVPDTPSNEAMLDIRIGCEDGFPYAETTRLQTSVVFKIDSPLGKIESVKMASLAGAVATPGGEIRINWESSVEKVKNFDVMVSYDAGAHYSRAGRTKETSFVYNVPADFAGSVLFQIVARRANASSVMSLVDLKDRVLVTNQE